MKRGGGAPARDAEPRVDKGDQAAASHEAPKDEPKPSALTLDRQMDDRLGHVYSHLKPERSQKVWDDEDPWATKVQKGGTAG